jgi:hypothetical protein
MEYSKLIAVTGLSSLYEIFGKKGDGILVRSLEDKSVKYVSSRSNTFSQLESIEVFTIRENVRLAKVFLAMEASEETLPDANDPKATKEYFTKVYPDLDFDRVYASDMKKMVRWYKLIKQYEITIELVEEEETTEE